MKAAKKREPRSVLPRLGIVLAYAVLATVLPNRRRTEKAPESTFAETPSGKEEPIAVQNARAMEPGRGRRAASPNQIPWKGWKDILWRTYAQIQEDRLLAISAGVVFFALLAIFPAVTALVSLYGLFASSSTIQDNLTFLSTMMPGERSVSSMNKWPALSPRAM